MNRRCNDNNNNKTPGGLGTGGAIMECGRAPGHLMGERLMLDQMELLHVCSGKRAQA